LDDPDCRLVGRLAVQRETCRKRVVGREPRARIERLDLAPALGRSPQHVRPGGAANLERPAGAGKGLEVLAPVLAGTHRHERQKHVVKLVRVAHLRCRLGPHTLDRVGIELAELPGLDRQAAPQRDSPRAALADLGVLVQIGERSPVEDLVSQHAWLDRLQEVNAHRSLLEAPHELLEALDVHRLAQTVAHRLADERMIGDLDRAGGRVVLAGRERREDRGHEVVRLHPLDVEGIETPTLSAEHRKRPVQVPPPARREHRAAKDRLRDGVPDVLRTQERGNVLERERMLRA
jgi:hypothetical protein